MISTLLTVTSVYRRHCALPFVGTFGCNVAVVVLFHICILTFSSSLVLFGLCYLISLSIINYSSGFLC